MGFEKAPATRTSTLRAGQGRAPFVTAPIIRQPQQDLENILKAIDRCFQPTTWEFVTSAGIEVSINPTAALPVSFNVGLSLFWVKDHGNPVVHKLTFAGIGPGIGWGPLPGSVTGSIPAMPSQGIGKIRRGPLGAKTLAREDFNGPCAVFEYSGGVAAGSSLCIIFFGASRLLLSLLSGNQMFSDTFITAGSSRAVGLLVSTSVGLQAGVAATVYNGSVT